MTTPKGGYQLNSRNFVYITDSIPNDINLGLFLLSAVFGRTGVERQCMCVRVLDF